MSGKLAGIFIEKTKNHQRLVIECDRCQRMWRQPTRICHKRLKKLLRRPRTSSASHSSMLFEVYFFCLKLFFRGKFWQPWLFAMRILSRKQDNLSRLDCLFFLWLAWDQCLSLKRQLSRISRLQRMTGTSVLSFDQWMFGKRLRFTWKWMFLSFV